MMWSDGGLEEIPRWPAWLNDDYESLSAYVNWQRAVEVAEFVDPQFFVVTGYDQATTIQDLVNAGTPTRRSHAVEALYARLCQQNISYTVEPLLLEAINDHQLIRPPAEVLKPAVMGMGRGTCIDLVLLFASLCMAVRLYPMVLLLKPGDGSTSHAMCLVNLRKDPQEHVQGKRVPQILTGEKAEAWKQKWAKPEQAKRERLVECMGFAKTGIKTDGRNEELMTVDEATQATPEKFARFQEIIVLDIPGLLGKRKQIYQPPESSRQQISSVLNVFSPPLQTAVNPYRDLFLTKGEVGPAYDFDTKLPPYIRRDVDEQIDEVLAEPGGKFVVLVGPSKAGKSRTAFEAILRHYGETHQLLVPKSYRDLKDVFTNFSSLGSAQHPSVLWLDNLDVYLSVEALSPKDLQQLLQDRLVVIGTLWPEDYLKFQGNSTAQGERLTSQIGESARRVLKQAREIKIVPTMSEKERKRAGTDYKDVHFEYGIGESLVALPELVKRYEYGSHGLKALVKACIDWRRAGVFTPVPVHVLEELFQAYYKQEEPRKRVAPEKWKRLFEDALEEVNKPVGSHQYILELDPQNTDAYTPYDPLVYYRENPSEGNSKTILPEVWEVILAMGSKNRDINLLCVGLKAYDQKNYEVSKRAWEKGMKLGDSKAAHNLGMIWNEERRKGISCIDGDEKEKVCLDWALKAYKKALRLGEPKAAYNLGHLYYDPLEDIEKAKKYFKKGAEMGDSCSAHGLGVLWEEEYDSLRADLRKKINRKRAIFARKKMIAAYKHSIKINPEAGSPLNLGLFYLNYSKAMKITAKYYLNLGASHGDEDARKNLDEMLKEDEQK